MLGGNPSGRFSSEKSMSAQKRFALLCALGDYTRRFHNTHSIHNLLFIHVFPKVRSSHCLTKEPPTQRVRGQKNLNPPQRRLASVFDLGFPGGIHVADFKFPGFALACARYTATSALGSLIRKA